MTQEQSNELAAIIARVENLKMDIQAVSEKLRAIQQSAPPAADEHPAPLCFIFASDELEV